ncbi:MAG TPA: ATP-binding protein [Byssovorax sp.]
MRAEAPDDLRDGRLAQRLTWLTALRLLVLTAFLAVTLALYPGGIESGGFSSQVALCTVAAAYFVAGLYAIVLRRGRGLAAASYLQLVTDQLAWTAIAYITGGATSGATSLYGLTTLSGAILLGLRGGLVAAASGLAMFTCLCAAFATHVIGPPMDQPFEPYATGWSEVAYPLLTNGVAIAVVTALSGYLAERLRLTGGRLELATARAAEAERLAMLGRVAGGLAHEIRNPLGAIAGSIELLRASPELTAEDRELCEIVVREAARLDDLVTDMLDLTRPRPLALAPLDVAATARDVVLLAAKSGRGADVNVVYEGPASLGVVADAAQLRQVIWNLVRNAIQASPAGAEVRVAITARDDRVELDVVDAGSGIPESQRDRLFDAFYTTRVHGVGIGLAVVKRVCDDHGFGLDVLSEEGRGATFRVVIPARA